MNESERDYHKARKIYLKAVRDRERYAAAMKLNQFDIRASADYHRCCKMIAYFEKALAKRRREFDRAKQIHRPKNETNRKQRRAAAAKERLSCD
ncbi:MAG: hypothetical protein ABIH03_06705 [Pseudomonadota bacterium]